MAENVLTEKMGPLPVWGWMGIFSGAALVYYAYQKSKAAKSSGGTAAADAQAAQQQLAAEEAIAANAAASTTPNYGYYGNGMVRGGGIHSWKTAGGTTAPPPVDTGTGTVPPTGTQAQQPWNWFGNWPPVGSGGTTPSPVPTPGPPSQVGTYKAPTGLSSKVSGTTVTITWSTAGQPSPPPSSWTVAIYASNGQLKSENTVGGDAGGGMATFTTSGLAKGTYHANVWANGGKNAPPHATTNFTIK